MILIPAGEFQMGSQAEEENDTEIRVKSIFVDAFLADKYPITNAQYKIVLDVNPQWEKNRIIETLATMGITYKLGVVASIPEVKRTIRLLM